MEEGNKDCYSWEENMYWTNFKSVRFTQFLHGNFNQRLALPKKFTNHLQKKLPEAVVLKGPGGSTWTVGLMIYEDTWFFEHGWEEFVKDNSLEENDFLVFKYNRELSMDVLMFDGKSLCEKETSYFVRKCVHEIAVGESHANKKMKDNADDEVHTASPPAAGGATPEQLRRNDFLTPEPKEQGKTAQRKRLKTTRKFHFPKRGSNIKNILSTADRLSSVDNGMENPEGSEQTPTEGNGISTPQYMSSRRPVTDEEKINALNLAQRALTPESFLVVMRPSHVYKRFFMTIPSEWLAKHFPPRSQNVILQMEGNTWRAKYQHLTRGTSETGGLTGGWKNFALENKLEEFDVCVFKLLNVTTDDIAMDVTIFRVINDVAPLTQIPP